jgi:hypothetical protein
MIINKKMLSAIQPTADIHGLKWQITLRLKNTVNFNTWSRNVWKHLGENTQNYFQKTLTV